jgi:hypothetical protein
MGIILAVKQPVGYLPIMAVREVEELVQTTVLWGDALLFSPTGLGQSEYFGAVLVNWENKPLTWGELHAVPVQPYIYVQRHQPIVQPDEPDLEAVLTLGGAGFYPLDGYWVSFSCPPFQFPLFRSSGRTK